MVMLISSSMTQAKTVSPWNPRGAGEKSALGLTSGLDASIFVLDKPEDYAGYSFVLLCLAFHFLTETSS